MKIVFLETAAQDIAWFRFYYRSVFPEGAQRAGQHFKAVQATLAANPYAGHPSETGRPVRELSLPKTPFVLIYRVTPLQIEVLRLWDSRKGGSY
jgi:plasmid stabilization system protein ParE